MNIWNPGLFIEFKNVFYDAFEFVSYVKIVEFTLKV